MDFIDKGKPFNFNIHNNVMDVRAENKKKTCLHARMSFLKVQI